MCTLNHSIYRDVQTLASSLAVLLCDPSKVCLLHEVCQLLPANDQVIFDRVAASVITEGKENFTTHTHKLQL